MNNYLEMAKALEILILELLEKGIVIPETVIDDLKQGRSLAGIQARQSCEGDTSFKAMSVLENVEMNLLSLVESATGRDNADKWQQRINDALTDDSGQECQGVRPFAPATRYNSGVPGGEYWIRVKESELSPVAQELEELLDGFELKSLPQDDGFLLLYGKKENVTSFLKDIRDRERQRR